MWMTGWASHTVKGRGNTWLGVLLLTWEKNQATCGVTKGSDFLETNLFVLFVLKEKTYFDSLSFRCFFSFTYLLLPYHWSLIQCSSVQCLFIFLLALLFSHTRLSKSRVHQSRQNRLVACLNIIVITCTNASNSCYSFFFFFYLRWNSIKILHVRLWSVSTVNTRLTTITSETNSAHAIQV